MIQIYGSPISTCTRKTLCTANELGLEVKLNVVDLAKLEHKAEANLHRQPFGKVPSLEDGAVQMFESRAICRYFIDAYGNGKLVPPDAAGRATMNKWIDVESFYFSAHAMTFVYEHLMGRPQGDEKLAHARASLDVTLDQLNQRLGESPYLAGPELTLADIVYLPYLEYLQHTPAFEAVQDRPHVAAWWLRCSERPSWKKTVAG